MSHAAPNHAAALTLMGKWGARLWGKQIDIVRAVFSKKTITTVQSCTGSGKTHVAAHIAWAWLLSAPDRLVLTTAPTKRQVDGALWKEMRAVHAEAERRGLPFGGKLARRAATWRMRDGWEAIGYSTGDDVNHAGWHSKRGTLVIVDDAQGLEDGAWDTLLSTLSGENDRMLALANPVRTSGRFYEYANTTGGDEVVRLRISAFETPNVRAGRTVIDGLVSLKQVNSRREIWGDDSPLWKSRVLGEFPDEDSRALVPLSWIDASNREWTAWRSEAESIVPESTTMGADLARLGKDRGVTALVDDLRIRDRRGIPRLARWVRPLVVHPKLETTGTTGYLLQEWRKHRPMSFRVDADGLGVGIFDRLVELRVPVVGMHADQAANDKSRFHNQRSEWLYGIREALRPADGFHDDRALLWLPQNDRLLKQLTTTLVDSTSDGRIKIEPKKLWKERHQGRSPDELDALAMTLCDEPAGSGASVAAQIAAYG